VNGGQQREGNAQAQDPTRRGEQRHVHAVEHEDLVAQHRKAVEKLRPFVLRHGGDGCLQLCDVRFQRDGYQITESALGAIAHHAQRPGQRCGYAQPQRGGDHQGAITFEQAVGEELQPQREQSVRHGGQQRQHECYRQQSRLCVVAALQRAPHGG